jgi:hypothetical protein
MFYNRQLPVAVNFECDGEPHTITGLGFDDLSGMQIRARSERQGKKLPVPGWVYNPETMQEIIVRLVESRAMFSGPQPGTVKERLERAEKRCLEMRAAKVRILDSLCEQYLEAKYSGDDTRAKFLAQKVEEADTAICMLTRPAATVAAILFYSFRMGLNSTGVATIMKTVKPPLVRQILHKARVAADVYIGVRPTPERGFGANRPQYHRSHPNRPRSAAK